MPPRRVWACLCFALLASSLGCGRAAAPPAGAGEVRVAAAADLRFALAELLADFGKEHPAITVRVSYGASGNFYQQLCNHAPFDLFLSADVSYPRRLADQGLASKSDTFVYAVGHLVVWTADGKLDLAGRGAQVLLDPAVRKVAVANPRHAPYGRAAVAALQNLKLYDRIRDKIVTAENVAQAAQFVESGAADAGVIALSLALSPPLRDKGRFWEVPADAYPTLEQGGVVLSWAQDPAAAGTLVAFLQSARGKAVLKRYGFVLPEG
jgi:molybdate transport system substrate-binding protein